MTTSKACRTQAERGGCAAVGVTFRRALGGVVVFAILDDLLHFVEILANVYVNRNPKAHSVKCRPELREDVALKRDGEGAFVNLAEEVLGGVVNAKGFLAHIAKAYAGAGVVHGDASAFGDIGL